MAKPIEFIKIVAERQLGTRTLIHSLEIRSEEDGALTTDDAELVVKGLRNVGLYPGSHPVPTNHDGVTLRIDANCFGIGNKIFMDATDRPEPVTAT